MLKLRAWRLVLQKRVVLLMRIAACEHERRARNATKQFHFAARAPLFAFDALRARELACYTRSTLANAAAADAADSPSHVGGNFGRSTKNRPLLAVFELERTRARAYAPVVAFFFCRRRRVSSKRLQSICVRVDESPLVNAATKRRRAKISSVAVVTCYKAKRWRRRQIARKRARQQAAEITIIDDEYLQRAKWR